MTQNKMTAAEQALAKAADLENQAYAVRDRERSRSLRQKANDFLEKALAHEAHALA